MPDDPVLTRIEAKLDNIDQRLNYTDRETQQRIALVEERIKGQLGLIDERQVALLARLSKVEEGRQWLLRSVAGTSIGLVITTVWAVTQHSR